MKAVASSASSSLQTPRLVLATTGEHPDLGYIVIVDWLSHAPMVDGVQITFQDGATSKVEFVEEIVTEINFNAKDMVRPRWRLGLIRLADPAGYRAMHNRLRRRYCVERPPKPRPKTTPSRRRVRFASVLYLVQSRW